MCGAAGGSHGLRRSRPAPRATLPHLPQGAKAVETKIKPRGPKAAAGDLDFVKVGCVQRVAAIP